MLNISFVRFLVDKYFSLECCNENLLVPVSIERISFSEEPYLLILIGNINYLATVGSFVNERIEKYNLRCIFIEEMPDRIYQIIDDASRLNKKDFILENKKLVEELSMNNFSYSNNVKGDALIEEKSRFLNKKRDLKEIKDLFEDNLIDEEDYIEAKRKILDL